MASPINFLNHTELEDYSERDDFSHVNRFEVDMVVGLARFFLQQDYKPSQITLIATYSGQLSAIQSQVAEKYEEEFHGIRWTSVDNFQGEKSRVDSAFSLPCLFLC